MRDLVLRVPVFARLGLASLTTLGLAVPFAALLPDGWPYWAYLLAGVPFGLAGLIIGNLWEQMGAKSDVD